ncbi:MAG: ABC transporter substrate-binding protein [Anaerolineales bacterium]|nr:ABC transporter substrate-binding protein [Anaerolineales bacterium]
MKSKRIILHCSLILFAISLASCWSNPSTQTEIRVGLIAYLKGDQSELSGLPSVQAATLAMEPIQVMGGLLIDGQRVPVTLIVEEIYDIPEEAVAATRRLINQEQVVAIIGPQYSSEAIPAGEVAEAAQVPMICPIATNPLVTADREFVFRMSFLDNQQGVDLALFAHQALGARRAAVLYDIADAYSSNVASVFQKAFETIGGQVVFFESYTSGLKDFSPFFVDLQQTEADILFLPNYSNDVLEQGIQARQAGITIPLLGGDGWDQRVLPAYPEFDGSFMAAHWSIEMQDTPTQDFVAAFQSHYNQMPNDTAALTFDAVNLILQAIQQQQSFEPTAIREGLVALDLYQGVSGPIDFISSGDPVKDVIILQFYDGQQHFYKRFEP